MSQHQQLTEQIFAGNSEMAMLMRSYDWSKTSLGSVEQWSQSLKTAVRIMLTCRQPMFVWWGEELINLYNDAYKAIVGGKHPTALGQPASIVWQEIWDQVGPRAESAMLKNEGTYDEALLLIMERNGYPEETYYTFSYSPIPDEQGKPSGIICANSDDTQRIIGERQLALLRELAAKTADARTFNEACTLSANCLGNNLYDLPFAMIYLVDPEQQRLSLAGTSGIDRHHAAVPETVDLGSDSLWSFAEVIETHQAVLISDLEAMGNLPTGAWQQPPHQVVAVPIAPSGQTGKEGVLIAGLNPFRLFDDRYRGFIDLVVAQISASIANAQAYEEERKRAEALTELDRAKTAFFSNVSHEFRTPLTLMLSPLEELSNTLDERLQPDEREQLQLIQRNGLRLQKLVNTLLDFSRIEAGRVQASYELTDLAAYTAELASVFRSLIERAGMNLVIDCPALSEPVFIDREMWEKIVLNLISNAFKFTFAGGITVRLQSVGNSVELSVSDTGVGIPEAELPRLFERFHRVSGTRSRTYEGSGIGLALVQELVKLHGGTIRVTSQLEQGTTFTIALPFGSAHLPSERIRATRTLTSTALGADPYVAEALRWIAEEENESWAMENGQLTSSSPTPPALLPIPHSHILLADDNADMRDYVKRLLSQIWEVEAVSNGLEALEAIARRVPDLVLSDVMMPGLDGFGLLAQLRATPRTQDIPIILLSARAGEESRIEGLEAGADDYLIKPFSARELMARVEANLRLSQLRQEATRKEQALRMEVQAVKDSLENVLSRIADQFMALDQEWRYTYANNQVTKVTGIVKEELLGRRIWDLFPDTVGSHFHAEVHRAVAEQTPVQFEYFYPTWGRWFENRVYPSADGVSIIITEVTDRKQAEAALRQSEAKFRQLANAMPQVVWVADINGQVEFVNDRWIEYSGLNLEQTRDPIMMQQIIPREDLQQLQIDFEQAQATKSPYQSQFRFIQPNNTYSYFLVRAIPIKDSQGRIQKWYGTSTDITDLKRREAERVILLQQEQAAREAAEQANRIKDEFLAVLSHELRSPLNPILGWVKLLRDGRLDAAKTAHALETIERNAKLQTQLIEDLLDVSRILQGKLNLDIAAVNLALTIEAAMETVRLAAEAKSIQIRTRLDPIPGQVLGDASRLQQVIWNLLTNAIKFTPIGGQVEIHLRQIESQESEKVWKEPEVSSPSSSSALSYAKITVSDTGKGIHPDFLPHVFEYFRQEDAKTTRKFGGLGLGLAIVRHLVELHGGTVQAESPGEGKGATFTVKLPLIKAAASRQQTAGGSLLSPLSSLPLAGVQILLVDDDTDTRDLIAFTLEGNGAIVTPVTSATAALQTIMQAQFDLLLSDIGMPDMDGYMLMRQIRTMPPAQGGTIPAIALTAYAGEHDQQQAISAGFQKHISKPVEPAVLVNAVVDLLKK